MSAPETVFMFSGQGSQYFQMARPLYEQNDTFRQWMNRLDEIARPAAGQSVLAALYSDSHKKGDAFDRLLLTHPAIFMVEYALAQTLIAAGVVPDLVLGASLGTFAAAAVAGFIDAEDALNATIRQAMMFEESCVPGGMTAVLGDPALFGEDFLSSRSEMAAVNFSSHFVVSAKLTELAALETELRGRDVSYQRLPVAFPFHSRWIDPLEAPFRSFMRSMPHRAGRLPLVCCDRTAADSSSLDFWDVVRKPIRFREAALRLDHEAARRFIDVGPAGTLATFLRYGLPASTKSTAHSILTPFGGDVKNLAAVVSAAGH